MGVVVRGEYRLGNQWRIVPELIKASFSSTNNWVMCLIWVPFIYWIFPDLRQPMWSSTDSAESAVFVGFLIIVVCLVLLLVMIFAPILVSQIALMKFALSSRMRPVPMEVTISEEGIKLGDLKGSYSLFAWDSIKRLTEFNRSIVMRTRFVLCIPKENFDDSDLAEVRRLAIENLGTRAKMKSS